MPQRLTESSLDYSPIMITEEGGRFLKRKAEGGFSAQLGGKRGRYINQKSYGYYWSASEKNNRNAIHYGLNSGYQRAYLFGNDKKMHFPVAVSKMNLVKQYRILYRYFIK